MVETRNTNKVDGHESNLAAEKFSESKESDYSAEAKREQKLSKGFQAGDRIEAAYRGGTEWYPGIVHKELENGRYHIKYDDGDREYNVKPEYVRPQPTYRRSSRRAGRPSRFTGGESEYEGGQVGIFSSHSPHRKRVKRAKKKAAVEAARQTVKRSNPSATRTRRSSVDSCEEHPKRVRAARSTDGDQAPAEETGQPGAEDSKHRRYSTRQRPSTAQDSMQSEKDKEELAIKQEGLDSLQSLKHGAEETGRRYSLRERPEKGQATADHLKPQLASKKGSGKTSLSDGDAPATPPQRRRLSKRGPRTTLGLGMKDGKDLQNCISGGRTLRDRSKIPKREFYCPPQASASSSSESSSSEEDSSDEEEEEDEDDEEEQEEEEEEKKKKENRRYAFRDRKQMQRTVTNITGDTPNYRRQRGYGNFVRKAEQEHQARRNYQRYPSDRSRRRRRAANGGRLHYDSSSESSNSDSSGGGWKGRGPRDEEKDFQRYRERQWARELDTIQPINRQRGVKGGMGGSTLDQAGRRELQKADANPVQVDPTITWRSLGGLRRHVRALKEMVLLPLLYPEVFSQFDVTPPRGILFYGPPGTGKTLTARALANACSVGGQHISFFMRKGADCLSKWVGEAERQLRLLFEQARAQQPSIIFFDEIDGLAPVRSSKQDQIHASIVSTLLALMDGLDSRGQVLVIGATNRPDAIDPALRRPGRFDRELCFSLPSCHARRQILDIHTRHWEPAPSKHFKNEIATQAVGYCGADLKALCAEAAIRALRRHYPQVYESERKLLIDLNKITVLQRDFASAMKSITPAAHRSAINHANPLPASLQPLLQKHLDVILKGIKVQFPILADNVESDSESEDEMSVLDIELSSDNDQDDSVTTQPDSSQFLQMLRPTSAVHRPRIIISGKSGQGQSQLAAALLHKLEKVQTFPLDLPSLVSNLNASSPEQALAMRFAEARRHTPCVLYIPNLTQWWENATQMLRSTLVMLLTDLPDSLPILILTTKEEEQEADSAPISLDMEENSSVDEITRAILGEVVVPGTEDFALETTVAMEGTHHVAEPDADDREEFFRVLLEEILLAMERSKSEDATARRGRKRALEVLPLAPVPEKADSLSVMGDQKQKEKDEHCLRELRIFMRAVLHELRKEKRYACFMRPVDPEEVPDYYDVIKHPMDLDTMRYELDTGKYKTMKMFCDAIELILKNAEEYNPRSNKDVRGRQIVHAAYNMKDTVDSMIHRFKKKVGYDLIGRCEEIASRRSQKQNNHRSWDQTQSPKPKDMLKALPPPPSPKKAAPAPTSAAASRAKPAPAPGPPQDIYRQKLTNDTSLSRAERARRRSKTPGDGVLLALGQTDKKIVDPTTEEVIQSLHAKKTHGKEPSKKDNILQNGPALQETEIENADQLTSEVQPSSAGNLPTLSDNCSPEAQLPVEHLDEVQQETGGSPQKPSTPSNDQSAEAVTAENGQINTSQPDSLDAKQKYVQESNDPAIVCGENVNTSVEVDDNLLASVIAAEIVGSENNASNQPQSIRFATGDESNSADHLLEQSKEKLGIALSLVSMSQKVTPQNNTVDGLSLEEISNEPEKVQTPTERSASQTENNMNEIHQKLGPDGPSMTKISKTPEYVFSQLKEDPKTQKDDNKVVGMELNNLQHSSEVSEDVESHMKKENTTAEPKPQTKTSYQQTKEKSDTSPALEQYAQTKLSEQQTKENSENVEVNHRLENHYEEANWHQKPIHQTEEISKEKGISNEDPLVPGAPSTDKQNKIAKVKESHNPSKPDIRKKADGSKKLLHQEKEKLETKHADMFQAVQQMLAQKTCGWSIQQLIGLRSFITKTVNILQDKDMAEILEKLHALARNLKPSK